MKRITQKPIFIITLFTIIVTLTYCSGPFPGEEDPIIVDSFTIQELDEFIDVDVSYGASTECTSPTRAICDCVAIIGDYVQILVTYYRYCNGTLEFKVGDVFTRESDLVKFGGPCIEGRPVENCSVTFAGGPSLEITRVRDCLGVAEAIGPTLFRWIRNDELFTIDCPIGNDPIIIPDCPDYTAQNVCYFLYRGRYKYYPPARFCNGELEYFIFGKWLIEGDVIQDRAGNEITFSITCT